MFPLLLVKQVFANEDGSAGTLRVYLVTSDTTISYDDIVAKITDPNSHDPDESLRLEDGTVCECDSGGVFDTTGIATYPPY